MESVDLTSGMEEVLLNNPVEDLEASDINWKTIGKMGILKKVVRVLWE